ncbi:MAG: CDP-glucose 4,6-dehydratase [Flavobacteriaceae bacterium]
MDTTISKHYGWLKGRRVFVTGHTGFKGSWLSRWLIEAGAIVTGYSLPPESSPNLFKAASVADGLTHLEADLLDYNSLELAISKANPEFVFHLAAQALVRRSYSEPHYTSMVNYVGTLNILEILRNRNLPCVAVLVTTDKCYRNEEWEFGYRENDALGGKDPYSASKAAAETVIGAYQHSYFQKTNVRAVSVRAGNVIGGGDWSEDRLVPDCMKTLFKGEPVSIRQPGAFRPWQHVLEALRGYLTAARWWDNAPEEVISDQCYWNFNFGPKLDLNKSVGDLVEGLVKLVGGSWIDVSDPDQPHEATRLYLSIDRAFHLLNWSPILNWEETLDFTVEWYKAHHLGASEEELQSLMRSQISDFLNLAAKRE